MTKLWTGRPSGKPTRRPGGRALALLSIPLMAVSAGFTFYVTLLEVPGGLASWSLTVLAFSLWLWPGMALHRRWCWSRTQYELTDTHARALTLNGAVRRELDRGLWPTLVMERDAEGSWSAWPTNPSGQRAPEPIFEGISEPEALRAALGHSGQDEPA